MSKPTESSSGGHGSRTRCQFDFRISRDDAIPLGLPPKGLDPREGAVIGPRDDPRPDYGLPDKGEDPRKMSVTIQLAKRYSGDSSSRYADWWQQTLITALPAEAHVAPATFLPDASGFSLTVITPGQSVGKVTGAVDSVINLAGGGLLGFEPW